MGLLPGTVRIDPPEALTEQSAGRLREQRVGELEAAARWLVVLGVGRTGAATPSTRSWMCGMWVPRYQAPIANAISPMTTNETRPVATYRIAEQRRRRT